MTTEPKGYTPGPWRDHDATTTGRTDEWHEILDAEHRRVATLNQDDGEDGQWSEEEVRAHARLIAAAPDLLDENALLRVKLRHAHGFLVEVSKGDTGKRQYVQSMLDAIDAVLDGAEGNAQSTERKT
ncbi:MAG: hypothetical protein U0990_09330 [Candidatus Nanopelagicales bacterium]|nr:hypothetical protein [Candidatus Nanopelagicales bacterium]